MYFCLQHRAVLTVVSAGATAGPSEGLPYSASLSDRPLCELAAAGRRCGEMVSEQIANVLTPVINVPITCFYVYTSFSDT